MHKEVEASKVAAIRYNKGNNAGNWNPNRCVMYNIDPRIINDDITEYSILAIIYSNSWIPETNN